jgi:hypothetical protein
MITKMIGVREFRQNMAAYYEDARKNNLRYIIMNHNQPIFKVEPLDKKDVIIEKLAFEINEAREDVKNKRFYSFENVCEELGI